MSPIIAVLDEIEELFVTDAPITEAVAERFLSLFEPTGQVRIMSDMLSFVSPFTEENPCPPIEHVVIG